MENSKASFAPAHRSRAFFSAHPVFRRDEYAAAVGRTSKDKVVSAMLDGHLRSGNVKRIARGVFASIPAHTPPNTWVADKYLVASKLKADAVIAYHSALELHGVAYTDSAEVTATTLKTSSTISTDDARFRFVGRPNGFDGKRDVVLLDRLGLSIQVTTLERTLVDLFDRIDLAGGAEELFNSLALVQWIRPNIMAQQASSMKNAGAAAAIGFWLENNAERLGVSKAALQPFTKLRPKHPQYVLGAKAGDAKFVRTWNIMMPQVFAEPNFEGA